MVTIDKIDKKLLYELDIDARAPISRLAKCLRVSRDVVSYRMRKLEEQHVIRGYRAFIDASRIGYRIFRAYFKFYAIPTEKFNALTTLLVGEKNTFWVGQADGFIDVAFGMWAKSTHEFYAFYRTLLEQFRPFIKQEYTTEVLTFSYLDRTYLLGSSSRDMRKEFLLGGHTPESFDAIDMQILKMLSDNARTSLSVIALALKMDSSSVLHRIRNLEKKKIILGYRADIDLQALGRQFYSVKMFLAKPAQAKEIVSYLRTILFSTNFITALSGWDVEVDLEVGSEEEYHQLMEDLKEHFPFISEILFYRAPRVLKVINAAL